QRGTRLGREGASGDARLTETGDNVPGKDVRDASHLFCWLLLHPTCHWRTAAVPALPHEEPSNSTNAMEESGKSALTPATCHAKGTLTLVRRSAAGARLPQAFR